MCRTISSQQYNNDLPYSRNAYIEQGMDVFLVSSIFDSLIQRHEPLRKTALGFTEEGRTQNFPGTGRFAGGPVTLTETLIAFDGEHTQEKQSLLVKSIAASKELFVGDIIQWAATNIAHETVGFTEAMLITEITDDTHIVVQRGFLGSPAAKLATGLFAYVRRTNGGFPGLSVSSDAGGIHYVGGSRPAAVSPVRYTRTVGAGVHGADSRTVETIFQRNNQLLGNIQTTGLRMHRGGPSTNTHTPTAMKAADINAKGMRLDKDSGSSHEAYNYGFDSDFRLYSVLGPFMRPAVIRDVIDTSEMSKSVRSSRFPGVTSIHDTVYGRAEDLIHSEVVLKNAAHTEKESVLTVVATGASPLNVLKVGDYITAPTVVAASAEDAFNSGEIMQVTAIASTIEITVQRGVLGTTAVALKADGHIFVIPSEDRNNNAKYSLAPIKGTTFATLQGRKTQYHTYHETDKIISFCSPMQSDLNNAPGAVIMSAITDDAVLSYKTVTSTAEIVDLTFTTHTLACSSIFTNPLLLHRWYTPGEAGDVDGDVTDVSLTTFKATLTLNANVGDYVMVGTATLSTGEIMRIVKIDTVTLTVV
jgi:hypothetical protein